MRFRKYLQPGHEDCEHPIQVAYDCPLCGMCFLVRLIVQPSPSAADLRDSFEFHARYEHKGHWLLLKARFLSIEYPPAVAT